MSTENNYKNKLALDLIEEHFGDITKDVARVLVKTENAMLPTIARKVNEISDNKSKLGLSKVRDALLVLVQHNLLFIHLPPEAEEDRDLTDEVAAKFAARENDLR